MFVGGTHLIILLFTLLLFCLIPLFIKRLKKVTFEGSSAAGLTVGLVVASCYATNRLTKKLDHIQSLYDWNYVVDATWAAYPKVLCACCIGFWVLFYIGFYLSKVDRKTD